MELTDEQQTAFSLATHVLENESCFLLMGSAGTGKTTLTKHISTYFTKKNYSICAIAPTHKAKRVISGVLNKNRIIPIPAFTVCSIMGKIKEHSYIGTKHYSNPND